MHIVKGVYQHYDNGIANGVSETWQLKPKDDVYQIDVTFVASYTLKATVLLDKHWRVIDFRYTTDDGLSGSYGIQGNQLIVRRVLAGNTTLEDTLVWSAETILDLPFLCCKGHTILHLHKHGTVPTYAPILRSGDRAGDLAKKSVSTHDEKMNFIVNAVEVVTTHYDYRRDYWLDDYGTVVKAQDKTYEMILTEYQR